jgi:hypothetical protein
MLASLHRWTAVACLCFLAPTALAQTPPASPNLNAIRAMAKALAPVVELPTADATYDASVPIQVRAPQAVTAKRYLVEIETWSEQPQGWSPTAQLPVVPAPDGSGRWTLEPAWFAQHAANTAKHRLRARVDDPEGPWSEWRSFSRAIVPARTPAGTTGRASVLTTGSTAAERTANAPVRASPGAPIAGGSSVPALRSSNDGVSESEHEAQVHRLRVGPGPRPGQLRLWDGIPPIDQGWSYRDGPLNVDWKREDLRWRFQYVQRGASARRGPLRLRWELSKAPFPAWGSWTPIPGFGLTGLITASAGALEKQKPTIEFTVDLASLAPRPSDWVATHTTTALMKDQPPGGSGTASAGAARSRQSPASSLPADLRLPGTESATGASVLTRAEPPSAASGTTLSSGQPVAVARPTGSSQPVAPALTSLFLRVVPVDSTGNPVGRASNAVELRFADLGKQPAFKFPFDPPTVTFVEYRHVRPYDFDWQCWMIAPETYKDSHGVVLVKKGQTTNLCDKKNGNILAEFIDTFGSFLDALKDAVNWISKAYASLKGELVAAVASAIPGCGSACQAVLEAGVNAGMAALGMPPSLPNFDQLEAMGEGYLVDMIAQQAAQSGVPFAEDAAHEAAEQMISLVKQAAAPGSGGSSLWIPDQRKQYKPLLFVVEVNNKLPHPTTPVTLQVTETASSRYLPRQVPVPSLSPGEHYKIAVTLEPAVDPAAWMDLLPDATDLQAFPIGGAIFAKTQQAEAALNDWKAAYQGGNDLALEVSLRPQFGAETANATGFTQECQAKADMCFTLPKKPGS